MVTQVHQELAATQEKMARLFRLRDQWQITPHCPAEQPKVICGLHLILATDGFQMEQGDGQMLGQFKGQRGSVVFLGIAGK